jgi:hypothetical protein
MILRKDDDAVKKLAIFEKKNEELTRNLQNVKNGLKSYRVANDLILNKLEKVLTLIAVKYQETNT